jgi:hypothetical protein
MARRQWFGPLVGWLGILAVLAVLILLLWLLLTSVRLGRMLA